MRKNITTLFVLISTIFYGQNGQYVQNLDSYIATGFRGMEVGFTTPQNRKTVYVSAKRNNPKPKKTTAVASNKNTEQLRKQREEEIRLQREWEVEQAQIALMEKELRNADNLFDQGNYFTAFSLYSKYVDDLDDEQLYRIGWMYFEGKGVVQDYIKASQYYIKAVDRNNILAMINLAYMYMKGIGGVKDIARAEQLLIKATRQENPYAMNLLGVIYAEKGKYDEAISYFIKANRKAPKEFSYQNILSVYMQKRDYPNTGLYNQLMIKEYGKDVIGEYAKLGDRNAIVFLASAYMLGVGYYQINLSKASYYTNLLTNKDYLVKLLYTGFIQESKGNYDEAVKNFMEFYKQKPQNAVLERIVLCYLHKEDYKNVKKWSEKKKTPLTDAVLFYLKCRNAMTLKEFDNCHAYQHRYNNLYTYYPFTEIEQELDIYFRTNYQQTLPKK